MKRILGLFLLLASGMSAGAQTLTVASYNLRNANSKDVAQGDGWAQRCPVIADLVRFHDFDIFGAQEVLHGQLLDLLAVLPDYGYIGVGRDDGVEKGEYAPILYKRDRFRLLDSGHFWLAEDSTRPVKGWDAAYIRICTWGRFLDRKSRKRFWFFTLHTDHKGQRSQIESCRLVLDKIREMCRGERVVLTGDFNVGETSDCHALLCESGILGRRLRCSADQAGNHWHGKLVRSRCEDFPAYRSHFHNTRFPAVALRHSDRHLSSTG